MDTPERSNAQIGTPISKLQVEDSPVFNYISSLSPIKTVKSTQTLGSLFISPSPVFRSPPGVSYKESRFRSPNNLSDPSKDVSVFNNEVTSTGIEVEASNTDNEVTSTGKEVEVINTDNEVTSTGKEVEIITTDPPQIHKNDCSTPSAVKDSGDNSLQEMLDNVRAKSQTPDWETLISRTTELIYGSPSQSAAFSCFLKRTSNSEQRVGDGILSILEPVLSTDVANNEPESSDALHTLHRGVRRRCLDFEIPVNNQKTMGESSSSCVVPNMGLHLNAIAMPSMDNNVGLQNSSSRLLHLQNNILGENQIQVGDYLDLAIEEIKKATALEELNKSPMKKRRKSEQAGEGDSSCKRCNCKKSKCLKLYCECFAAGFYCIEPCSCINCFNKPIHEDVVIATRKQIMSRNPNAFDPKVMRSSDSITEVGDEANKTPASARHKRGCNCKKSNCLKKYCECYQGGVGCSKNCRCEGCRNKFGRKDGSLPEQDEENKTYGKISPPKLSAELFNPSAAMPATPIASRQPLAQLPNTSNISQLPQMSHLLLGTSGSSSSGMCNFRIPDENVYSFKEGENQRRYG